MKKVKFKGVHGPMIVMLPGAPVEVQFDDVIEVPDEFFNANFEDVVEDKPKEKSK